MKLISLNTWGGRAGLEQLRAFFAAHQEVDIFCLQEVWNGGEHMLGQIAGGSPLVGMEPQLYAEIARVLPDHRAYFRPHFYDFYGLALFVRSNLPVLEEGELFVYKERGYISRDELGNHARNLQYLTLDAGRGPYSILNLHGLWNGQGKGDSDDRLLQSDKITTFIKQLNRPVVLVGDFNLRPETESVAKLERAGLRNLIIEYGITSTRTSLYTKPEQFADYAFVSPGIEIKDFKILPDQVSDHAALLLEFE